MKEWMYTRLIRTDHSSKNNSDSGRPRIPILQLRMKDFILLEDWLDGGSCEVDVESAHHDPSIYRRMLTDRDGHAHHPRQPTIDPDSFKFLLLLLSFLLLLQQERCRSSWSWLPSYRQHHETGTRSVSVKERTEGHYTNDHQQETT